jgi:hypothetical protein
MKLKVVITDYSSEPASAVDVVLDGTELRCDNPYFYEFLTKSGAMGYDGKTFFPKDGKAFMDALQVQFSGSFVRASAPVVA